MIRLSTGRKSAKDVFESLERARWSMPADARHRLFTEEDQAQRALLWCDRRSVDEHRVLNRLHKVYRKEVEHLLSADAGANVLLDETRRLLAQNTHPVLLVHPCCHFARCYALNHFLVLLLSKVAIDEKLAAGPKIRPGVGVSGVSGGSHTCANSPWACHGQEHKVQLEHRPLCHGAAGGLAGTEIAHVVVIRHGIAQQPAFVRTPMAFARQVMPYWLPGP